MYRTTANLSNPRLRLSAAGSALFFVAAFVCATLLIGQPVVHAGQEGIEHSLVERGLGPVFGGMFLLTLGFLALIVTMTFLAQAVGRRTATGTLAAQTAWAAGIAYVVVIVGVGLSAGGAGLWALHHDAAMQTVLSVNNIRNFSYFAAMPFMGVYSLALGVAALADRVLTRWVGWGGVAAGVGFLLAVPAAAVGVQFAMPLWLLWWIGVGISLLRYRTPDAIENAEASARSVVVGHD
jgi:hypothetical protein